MARFGYETIGELGTQNVDDRIQGSVFTCPTAGTADSITIYISSNQSGNNWQCGIYLHSDLSLVGETNATSNVTSAAWNIFTFASPPDLLAATDYVLVCWGEQTTPGAPYLAYDDGDDSVQGHYEVSNYDATLPLTMTATHEDRKYSIYCDYTEPTIAKILPLLREKI